MRAVAAAAENVLSELNIAEANGPSVGGKPVVTPKPVKTSDKAEDMLRFDLDNEGETIKNYRLRVRHAESLNYFALAETLRKILVDEQDHHNSLATALGIDPPEIN